MITHFCAVVLTFRDLFWQIGQGHATVKFAIAQITVKFIIAQITVRFFAQISVSVLLHRSVSVCYRTDHSQCRQTVLCIMWGWMLLWCMNWDLLQSFNAFFAFVISGILLQTNFRAFSFCGYFMFLLMVFHKVLELNRHLTLSFCCIVVSWIMQSLILVDCNWYFGWTRNPPP